MLACSICETYHLIFWGKLYPDRVHSSNIGQILQTSEYTLEFWAIGAAYMKTNKLIEILEFRM